MLLAKAPAIESIIHFHCLLGSPTRFVLRFPQCGATLSGLVPTVRKVQVHSHPAPVHLAGGIPSSSRSREHLI